MNTCHSCKYLYPLASFTILTATGNALIPNNTDNDTHVRKNIARFQEESVEMIRHHTSCFESLICVCNRSDIIIQWYVLYSLLHIMSYEVNDSLRFPCGSLM